MKVFSVRVNPDYGQYLYIVSAKTPEQARDMVKFHIGGLTGHLQDEDWSFQPPNEEYFFFCEIVELPLTYKGDDLRIIDYGGYEE